MSFLPDRASLDVSGWYQTECFQIPKFHRPAIDMGLFLCIVSAELPWVYHTPFSLNPKKKHKFCKKLKAITTFEVKILENAGLGSFFEHP